MQLYLCLKSFRSVIGSDYLLGNQINYQELVTLPYSEQGFFKRVTEEEIIRDTYTNELDIQD